MWETDAAIPDIDKLIALSRLFGVSVGWLLGVEDPAAPQAGAFSEDHYKIIEELVKKYQTPPKQHLTVFHYLFGYIHPFYDGNGRTSRFISSYLLSRELTPLIGFRLSYTIKENISKYYKAFEVCNDPHNKGELTPFVDMFLSIVEISMQQLLETLEEKKQKWDYYWKRIKLLPSADKANMFKLYDVLIQASLFSNIGIGRDELIKHMGLSENTVRNRLKLIPDIMLIENRQKGKKYYLLNLEEADKLFE